MGIEDWNTAFEKAGFKNAIIAKDPPTKEEDPNFSPEDIRYSTVRYVASTTRNATGPSVSDPRTGKSSRAFGITIIYDLVAIVIYSKQQQQIQKGTLDTPRKKLER